MTSITFDDLYAFRLQFLEYNMNESIIIKQLKELLINNNMALDDINDYLFHFYISIDHNITFEEINNINIMPNNNDMVPPEFIIFNMSANAPNETNILNAINSLINTMNVPSVPSVPSVPDDITMPELVEDDITIPELVEDDITIPEPVEDDITIPEPVEDDITMSDVMTAPVFPSLLNGMFFNNYYLPVTISNHTIQNINIIGNLLNIILPNIPIPVAQPLNDIVITTDVEYLNKLTNIIVEETLSDNCSICRSSIDKGNIVLDIECKHYFHKECLLEYLQNYNHICPLCRKEIGSTHINY